MWQLTKWIWQMNGETYIIFWWIEGNLPQMTSMIRFWNEGYGEHMLNEEVWCSWDENGNWL